MPKRKASKARKEASKKADEARGSGSKSRISLDFEKLNYKLKEDLKNSYPMQQKTETRCKSFGFDGQMIYRPLMKPTTLIMSPQWKNKR